MIQETRSSLAFLIEWPPHDPADYRAIFVVVLAVVGVIFVFAVLKRLWNALFGRRDQLPDLGFGPVEDLGEYPPPRPLTGSRRLMVEGVPARLRLVVIAPPGNLSRIDENAVEPLLDHVLWGLGPLVRQEKPRICFWPPQLSSQGFTVSFQRRTLKPEADNSPSHWIILAGPTPPRPRPVLLGLALWTDEANSIGRINMDPQRWGQILRIQNSENE